MTKQEIKERYEQAGGEFYSSPVVLSEKLKNVKALVFDWDGVWHSGRKTGDVSSFSEVDSMGLNMLRYGYYLMNGAVPLTLIITGENNVTAFDFAEREHLDGVIYKAKDKGKALDFMTGRWGIQEDEVLFVFDDILDLGMASRAGVNFLVNRTGSALFHDFVREKGWADYKTNASGGEHGVREICELTIGLLGKFQNVIEGRMQMAPDYQAYWSARNEKSTHYFTAIHSEYKQVNRP